MLWPDCLLRHGAMMIKTPDLKLIKMLAEVTEIRLSFSRAFTWEPKQVTPAAIEWLWWFFVLPHDGQ